MIRDTSPYSTASSADSQRSRSMSTSTSSSDIAIQAREMVKARERIARTIARETGKSLEEVLGYRETDK